MNKNIKFFSSKEIGNEKLTINSFGSSLKKKLVPKINLNDLIKKTNRVKIPLFGLNNNLILNGVQTERSRKSIIDDMLNKKNRIEKNREK